MHKKLTTTVQLTSFNHACFVLQAELCTILYSTFIMGYFIVNQRELQNTRQDKHTELLMLMLMGNEVHLFYSKIHELQITSYWSGKAH